MSPKAPRKKPTNPTVRQMLNQIDEWLAKGNNDSEHLWYVLTALRGPDNFGNEEDFVKSTTVCPIRARAFPKTSRKEPFAIGASFGGEWKRPIFMHTPSGECHFYCHVMAAARVLGLEGK